MRIKEAIEKLKSNENFVIKVDNKKGLSSFFDKSEEVGIDISCNWWGKDNHKISYIYYVKKIDMFCFADKNYDVKSENIICNAKDLTWTSDVYIREHDILLNRMLTLINHIKENGITEKLNKQYQKSFEYYFEWIKGNEAELYLRFEKD